MWHGGFAVEGTVFSEKGMYHYLSFRRGKKQACVMYISTKATQFPRKPCAQHMLLTSPIKFTLYHTQSAAFQPPVVTIVQINPLPL